MVGNRNLSVGIFVTAALTILVVFLVWITGKKGNEPTAQYAILIEDDVSGLMLGGPVFFLGVNVGQVNALTIVPDDPRDPDDSVAVQVDIEVLSSTPVTERTWATLAAQGITGVSVINLSNARDELRDQDAELTVKLPMIPYRDTGFSAILSSAPAILSKMETLLDRAGEVLNEDNQRILQDTLANIESMTGVLSAKDSGLAQLPATLNGTLNEIQATAEELRVLLQEGGPGLTAALDNMDRVTRNLAEVSARLDDWIEVNEAEMQSFVGEGLGQVPELVTDARSAIRELEKLLEQLRLDPSEVIYQVPEDAVPVEEN